jgi:photosystem II stability/assembly factor-like uncharacterized protein
MKITATSLQLLLAIAMVATSASAQQRSVPTVDGELRRDRVASPTTVVAPSLPSVAGAWVAQGPAAITGGQVDGMTPEVAIGAIHTVVAHPTNADTLWIGAVNGGIWKTTNATNASPTWTPLTDTFGSLSIGALALDPTDATRNTLVAGAGRYSSFGRVGGPLTGILRTTNGGTNWTQLVSAGVVGANVSGIAARGATIVVSIDLADNFTCANIGIFRSTNTGASFTQISGGASGLPLGRAFDVAADPTNNAVLYTAVRDAPVCGTVGGTNGIYKSINTGLTWTKVSSPAIDALMVDALVSNTRIAVGASGEVYVGVVQTGQLGGLFRSATGSGTWTALDTPATNEGGTNVGIHPRQKPGSQGGVHFSIVADPTDANIVYVGGDRQPLSGDGTASTPNSIGSVDYTGRLFRVNAAAGAGTQATPLTHCAAATAACNGSASTSSNSAPHADSRRMTFDANGNLIETDDGGIYRRTNPRTTGDWFSVTGSLRVTEMHDVAYDRVSNMIVSGNQDNGTSEQSSVGGLTWVAVSGGDGGDVSIDDSTSGTESRRYSSFQNLAIFRRRIVDASGVTSSLTFPALTVLAGGPALVGQFATPVELNGVDPTRVLIGAFNDLYESLDRGDTITALGFSNKPAAAMIYGGRTGGVDNEDLIWAISSAGINTNGPNVFVRTSGAGAPVQTSATPGTTTLRDIAVDPSDWQKAFVVNRSGRVFSTTTTGTAWTDVTGNLGSGTNDLRTIAFVPGAPNAIVVGGVNGVFRMAVDNPGVWNQLGTGLTNAPVFDLDYDAVDDTLVAGTMGRGAWKLNPVANLGPLLLAAPTSVVATATAATTVNITWTVAAGAASYRVYRSSDRVTFPLVGSPVAPPFDDTTAVAGTAYLYKVRSFNGAESADSNVDLATTVIFTDPTLTAATTKVKLAHFNELRTAVNAVRTLAGLVEPMTFTAPLPASLVTVRGQHVMDLRGALDAARLLIPLSTLTYTDPTITADTTKVKAAHLTEARNGVK